MADPNLIEELATQKADIVSAKATEKQNAFQETEYLTTGQTSGVADRLDYATDPVVDTNGEVIPNVFRADDGTFTYVGEQGKRFSGIRDEKSLMQQIQLDKAYKQSVDAPLGENMLGGALESAVGILNKGRRFIPRATGSLTLEEATQKLNDSYDPNLNDDPYSVLITGNEEKPVEFQIKPDSIQTFKDIQFAENSNTPLTEDQQTFKTTRQYSELVKAQAEVDKTYEALAEIAADSEAISKWSGDFGKTANKIAFQNRLEKDGFAEAVVGTVLNDTGTLLEMGVESLPATLLIAAGKHPASAIAVAGVLAENTAIGYAEEFYKRNNRAPTQEELTALRGWAALSATGEVLSDRILLGKFGPFKYMTEALGKSISKPSLSWLAEKGAGLALGITAEGISGATTEFSQQMAIEGEANPDDIAYAAFSEAAASPGVVAAKTALDVSTAVIVDQATKERFTKGNIDEKIAANNAELDEFAPVLTEEQRAATQAQLEADQAEVESLADQPNRQQRVDNLNRRIKRNETKLTFGRDIKFDANTDEISADIKPLLQRSEQLDARKEDLNQPGLVEKLSNVGQQSAEAVQPETQEAEAVQTAVETAPEYAPNSETVTPEATPEVVLDPNTQGYDPLAAVDALVAKLDGLTAGTTEAENLLADINYHLEIAGNYAFGDQITEEAKEPAIQRLTAAANKINEFVPTQEVDTKKEEDSFLDLTTPLDQVSNETKNSIDPNDDVQPMSAEEAQAMANEWLESTRSDAQSTGQDYAPPANRDTTAGVEATPGTIPPPTTTTVTEGFLSNPNYQQQQGQTGQRRPGLVQIVDSIKASDTVSKLNARVKYLENFTKKHVAKLQVYRAAQQAFADTQQTQVIYETKDGYTFASESAGRPDNATRVAFNVTNITGISKVVDGINREANAAINAVERARIYQPKKAAQINRRAANTIAERTGQESVDQRAAREAAANQPKPDQVDRGDAATPAPAEQSGAANPQMQALQDQVAQLTALVQQLVQQQGQPTQTETTTPAATEAATVDQTAQEAPQTPDTATPAEAETTAAPVQEEQAQTPEETTVDNTPINTKAAFIAKYGQYFQEGTRKLVPFEELPAEVLREMAADIGACK